MIMMMRLSRLQLADSSRTRGTGRGFTLVELLVSLGIVSTLFAILLPAASTALDAARMYKCQANLRTTAFDFTIFADDQMHGNRGDDGDGPFRLETFQESQYCIDEFWCWPGDATHTLPDEKGNDPMRCPDVPGELTLRRAAPCTRGGVGPPQNISFSFNVWMHRPEVEYANGRVGTPQVRLTEQFVLDNPLAPLCWDVDGDAAFASGMNPVFTGPALDSRMAYAGNRAWFPGTRHGGQVNAAFLDGHVDASATPLDEPQWSWRFTPPR